MQLKNLNVYVLVFLTALCSYLYELILAQTATSLIGGLYTHYVTTFAVYILALGFGSLLPVSKSKTLFQLLIVELALTFIGGMSVFLLQYTYDLNVSLFIIQATHIVICFSIGLLSGWELPLLYQDLENRKLHSANATAIILSVDYLGMFVGSLLFASLLIGYLGAMFSAVVVALVNLALVFAIAIQIKNSHRKVKFEQN